MAWELYTDNTMRTYPNWTGEAYDPNNLCSFNSPIQNIASPQQRFTNQTTKSFKCVFLDLHSIQNIYMTSNMANYDSVNPEGYPSNIVKNIL